MTVKRWRRILAAAVAILLALGAARLCFLDGLLRRITIAGPSMAPSLCGAHYEIECSECVFPFRVDAESPPPNGEAACPNCGCVENKLAASQLKSAERVIIDSWPLLWRKPLRVEVVAARLPRESDGLVVKRVAAMEASFFSIEQGDLYVDRQLQRKTLEELSAVRVLVHDNDFQHQPSKNLPPRWRSTQEASNWTSHGSLFRHASPNATQAEPDWLEYQHWPCTADATLRGTVAPIRDNDSYNQGPGPRELNAVSDLLLACRVRCSGSGELFFAATDGDQRFEASFQSHLNGKNGDRSGELQFPLSALSPAGSHIEFGLCDQQLLVAVDGRTIACRHYNRPVDAVTETLHPLAIGVRGLTVEISHLRVWRDIYLLNPQGLPSLWKSESILPQQVVLLGDNPPVSIDSRHWQPAGIPPSDILGLVRQPFWMRNRTRAVK